MILNWIICICITTITSAVILEEINTYRRLGYSNKVCINMIPEIIYYQDLLPTKLGCHLSNDMK